MDQIRRGWTRDEGGWWSCNLEAWDSFGVKLTKTGEETLFRCSVEEAPWEIVDLLQCATHVKKHVTKVVQKYRKGGPMMKLAEVLETTENPAPFLEHLCIWSGKGNVESVLEAIASNKLPRLK
ncbi:unnamed protein product [Calypogeia fissa]